MAVYQNSTANLGVKLEITHASPDVANNRTTITYKASIYKTGSHNPWNNLSQTPMYLTINGQSLHSTATGNYDLRGGTYQQVIKTGTLVIPHNADGSKSFTFSWNVNFTSTGYGYGDVATSGTYVLPNIARASTFTIPSTTITTGSAFTVTIARASGSFTHKVSYIVGNSEVVWTSNATTSYAATVPHSLFNSHKSTASVSGVIRVTTMNGSVEVGSNQRTVTINLVSSAIPTVGSLSSSNSNKSVFTGASQYIRGISRLTATAGSVSGSYSSTIASYEFRVVRANGTTIFGAASKTTSSHQFSAFDFPNSSSEVVTPQVRVRDSRGRYSAWRAASAIRVHYYAPPAIGTMTVRRVGSGNTTLQVTRNYSITLLYESGAGSNINTASLRFQHRTKGTTTATDNAGAKSTTTSLSNSNANLSGTFSAGTSYEVRAILNDAVAGQVIGSWISVGTEFVPMDIGPKGLGVGKVHSNGAYNLEVGIGGIRSEGNILIDGVVTGNRIDSTGSIRSNGIVIEQGRHLNFRTFTVGGTANNYYPVVISPQATFGFHRYGISRGYNAPAPNTWNTSTHRGGLTFDVEWSGDTNWGGNDKAVRVIEWNETYTTIVGGLKLARTGGLVVWLRGGGAEYRFTSERGQYGGVQVFLSGFTDGSGENFPVRSSPVASEINNSYPVRGAGALYEYGHRVITTNTISNHAATVTTGNNANGNWYQVGSGLLICSQNFSFANKYSDYTLTGSWTFPKAFSSSPSVSATGRTSAGFGDKQEIMNGTLNQVGNTTTTGVDFSWHRFSGANFGSSSRKYLTVFAIGFP